MEELLKKVKYNFFTDKLHPDDYQNTMNAMTLHMQGKVSIYETEYRIQAKDGSWKWFSDRGKITQRDINGNPEFASGIVFDITTRKEQELDLKKENEHIYIDSLTSGSNKNSFKLKVEIIIKNGRSQYAFLVLDLNKFNLINDLFGYVQGDLLLSHINNVLSSNIKNDEIFARISGYKFYMLLEYVAKDNLGSRLEKITEEIFIITCLKINKMGVSISIRDFGQSKYER